MFHYAVVLIFTLQILCFSRAFQFPDDFQRIPKPCDYVCTHGGCEYKDCPNETSCPGGACLFIRCYGPTCSGGACTFEECYGATCTGGR